MANFGIFVTSTNNMAHVMGIAKAAKAYHPDMKICMFNGPTTEEMYKRYEHYWND